MSSATTSSLTQSVSSASRASRAVSRASAAVWQPAVFGRTATPACRMVPIRDPSPAPPTRRMATVVSSVPEVLSTLPSTSRDWAPPVPTISRDVSVRPPICQPPRSAAAAAEGTGVVAGSFWMIIVLASLNRGHDLDLVALGERGGRPGAARNDLAVDGGGDALRRLGELADEVGQGEVGGEVARGSVDGDGDG